MGDERGGLHGRRRYQNARNNDGNAVVVQLSERKRRRKSTSTSLLFRLLMRGSAAASIIYVGDDPRGLIGPEQTPFEGLISDASTLTAVNEGCFRRA